MARAKMFLSLIMLLLAWIEAAPSKIRLAPADRKRKDKQDCFIVKFRNTTSPKKKKDLFDTTDGTDGAAFDATGGFVKCGCRLGQLKQLADDDAVDYIEEDSVVSVDLSQSTGTSYWNLDRIDQTNLPLDQTFNYIYTGQGIPIYILDTGVNGAHEEFTGRMGQGTDIIGGGTVDPNTDCQGHGSHVAGTAAGTRSGVAKLATIVSVRVLGCDGGGTSSTIVSGINWAITQQRGVISMSLGGGFSQAMNDAVATATANNFVVVMAAGNSNTDACTQSPASSSSGITVAATNSADQRSSYSNYGTCVDIFAPGDSILSASNTVNNGYVLKSGTSMATPLVAGAAAAYLSGNPTLSQEQLGTVLQNEATSGVVSDVMGSPNLLLKSSGVPNLNSRSPSPSPLSQSPSASPTSPSPSPLSPTNDLCWNALELPCNGAVTGSTQYASMDGSPVTCTVTHTSPEIWYYINVPANGTVTLSMCNAASYDTKLTLWGGYCSAGNLTTLQCIAGNDDATGCSLTSSLTQTLTAGTYLVMVHGYKTFTGTFTLSATCPTLPITPSPRASQSPSASPRVSPSPPAVPSPSPQASRSPSPVPSLSPSSLMSPSPSPAGSPSPSPVPNPSPSPLPSPSPSPIPSPSPSPAPSPSPSPAINPTPSPVPSPSSQASSSPSPVPSPSPSPVPSPSLSPAPSSSPGASSSPSPLPSPSPQASPSPPLAPSPSPQTSPSPSLLASASPIASPLASNSPVASSSPSPRPSPSPVSKGKKGRSVEDDGAGSSGSGSSTGASKLAPVVYGLTAATSVLFGFVVGVVIIVCLIWHCVWPKVFGRQPHYNNESPGRSETLSDAMSPMILPEDPFAARPLLRDLKAMPSLRQPEMQEDLEARLPRGMGSYQKN